MVVLLFHWKQSRGIRSLGNLNSGGESQRSSVNEEISSYVVPGTQPRHISDNNHHVMQVILLFVFMYSINGWALLVHRHSFIYLSCSIHKCFRSRMIVLKKFQCFGQLPGRVIIFSNQAMCVGKQYAYYIQQYTQQYTLHFPRAQIIHILSLIKIDYNTSRLQPKKC